MATKQIAHLRVSTSIFDEIVGNRSKACDNSEQHLRSIFAASSRRSFPTTAADIPTLDLHTLNTVRSPAGAIRRTDAISHSETAREKLACIDSSRLAPFRRDVRRGARRRAG